MDPAQLQAMQELGTQSDMLPDFFGTRAPLSQGGASALAYESQRRANEFQRVGQPYTNVQALTAVGLGQYGAMGQMAESLGNPVLGQVFRSAGMLSNGNSTNVISSMQAHKFLQMQNQVLTNVSPLDAESYYRSFRGMAALSGQPFNAEQRSAARSLASSVAGMGPYAAMMAPDLVDSMAGERGSAAVMANQMMDFNRYRVDPTTGKMGYSAEANTALVENMFNNMYSDENLPNMRGIRAGDAGQLYKALAQRGLAGTRETLRDRTLSALEEARSGGTDLRSLAQSAGVADIPLNFSNISNSDLEKLRGTSEVQTNISKIDAKGISGKLQGYTDSLAALREIFGENGTPNAPIPMLIGALEELTSGQMQKFDATRLNTMVRDLQAISQMTGKSVDQLAIMNREAAESGQRLGIGTTFSTEAVKIGATTGQAYQEVGGATGFGSISKTEAEAQAMERFNLGVSSEYGNMLGTLGRINDNGGFANNAAGKRLESILAAADSGQKTFIDPSTGKEEMVPIRETDYRRLISQGGVEGMSVAEFNGMLAQRTSNLRNLNDNPDRQKSTFTMQSAEIEREMSMRVVNTVETGLTDTVADPRRRTKAAVTIGKAASAALDSMTAADALDRGKVASTVGDAIRKAAEAEGIALSDENIRSMADQSFGAAETRVNDFGYESLIAYKQVQGSAVSSRREAADMQNASRRDLNKAMQGLGAKDSLMTRAVIALQKAGDDPEKANLTAFFGDVLGATTGEEINDRLTPLLQAVVAKQDQVDKLEAEMGETKDPARRAELARASKKLSVEIENDITKNVQVVAKEFGIGGNETRFDREDAARVDLAQRQIEHDQRYQEAVQLGDKSTITTETRKKLAASELTESDLIAIAELRREGDLKVVDSQVDNMNADIKKLYNERLAQGMNPEAAKDSVRSHIRTNVDNQDYLTDVKNAMSGLRGDDLDRSTQDAVIRARRKQMRDVTKADIEARVKATHGVEDTDEPVSDKLDRRRAAENMLRTEQRLRTAGLLGEDSTLMGDLRDIEDMSPELRSALAAESDPQKRAEIADGLITAQSKKNLTANYDEARKKAQMYARTGEGKTAIERSGESLATLSNLRDDYLLDTEASKKGGLKGVLAVRKSREAEGNIRADAERYADGDVDRYAALGVLGISDKGKKRMEEDFEAMEPGEKRKMLERLQAVDSSYANKDVTQLTIGDMRLDVDNNLKKNIKTMGDSRYDMLEGDSAGSPDNIAELIQVEADTELMAASQNFARLAGFTGKDEEDIKGMQVAPDSNMEANMRTVSAALSSVGGKKHTDEAAVFGSAGLSNLQKLDRITDDWNAEGVTMADKKAMAKRYGYGYDEMASMMRRTSHLGLDSVDAEKGELTGKTMAERMKGVSDTNIEAAAKSEEDKTMRITGTLEVVGVVNGQATARDLTGVAAR